MSSASHCIFLPHFAENRCRWVSRSASLTCRLGFHLSPQDSPWGLMEEEMLVHQGMQKVASGQRLCPASSEAVPASQVHPVKEMRLRKIFPDPAH